MTTKTCAIILANSSKEAKTIRESVQQAVLHGCTHFLSGLEYGAGLTAAECVLACKEQNPAITLECVIPFEEYTTVWDEPSRDRYFDIVRRCDRETLLQHHFTPDCLDRQREYLLLHSEETIVI